MNKEKHAHKAKSRRKLCNRDLFDICQDNLRNTFHWGKILSDIKCSFALIHHHFCHTSHKSWLKINHLCWCSFEYMKRFDRRFARQAVASPCLQTRWTSAAVCEAVGGSAGRRQTWAQLWASCCKEKYSHVTPIMTYIKDLSLCKAQKRLRRNVTFPPSVDAGRWHHLHRQGRLPWVKRRGSLIAAAVAAAAGFGCPAISFQSHTQRYSADKSVKDSVGKIQKISDKTRWVMFCFFCQPSTG